MKSTLQEFKQFLLRGNIIDLAVAVVIGTAFGEVVKSLVTDLITPLIGIPGSTDFGSLSFTINESVFRYGIFLNTLISFVSIAAAVFFFVVKPTNHLMERLNKKQEAIDVADKQCPECLSIIPIKARRCAHCTSVVSEAVN